MTPVEGIRDLEEDDVVPGSEETLLGKARVAVLPLVVGKVLGTDETLAEEVLVVLVLGELALTVTVWI